MKNTGECEGTEELSEPHTNVTLIPGTLSLEMKLQAYKFVRIEVILLLFSDVFFCINSTVCFISTFRVKTEV